MMSLIWGLNDVVAVRQEARDDFSRRLAIGGLCVCPEVALKWWPGTKGVSDD